MKPHGISRILISIHLLFLLLTVSTQAQSRHRPPSGGRLAIIVDERLSALRASPGLSGKLLQRISRGRFVAIQARKVTAEGIVFYRVKVTRRTAGWIQKEAIVSPAIEGDTEALWRLIQSSQDFDGLARAKIFLDAFPRSALRARVLLLFADTAESSAAKLSREAGRRLEQVPVGSAPLFSYFLNYSGLDRYNRQGVRFIFDRQVKQFHYDGWAWREVLSQYPHSPEAIEARKRLALTQESRLSPR
ncbi:MAG TPA: hypothetical protein VIV66_15905 [Pyrinomonadaceae bacterium]